MSANSSVVKFGDCKVDRATRQLWRSDQLVHLPRLPFDVLTHLIDHRTSLVRRDELLELFWSRRPGGDEALTRCLSSIRKAVGDLDEPARVIETRRAEGYRFIAPLIENAVTNVESTTVELDTRTNANPPLPKRYARVAFTTLGVGVFGLLLGAMWMQNQLDESAAYARKVKILWVDDHPERNQAEISTLMRAGVIVDTVRSNAEAASHLVGREYDLVISDIGRDQPQQQTAGLDLPRELTTDRNRVPPVVYYVGKIKHSNTPDGYPIATEKAELFRLVADVIKWKTGETLDVALLEPNT